ncbi:MAG: CPBP family intramembrane metalloprotease [Spirochaetaceae bacterium]|nr:CPBP family intramembrane metalloprotease [Spirochaetaceae bacterium]
MSIIKFKTIILYVHQKMKENNTLQSINLKTLFFIFVTLFLVLPPVFVTKNNSQLYYAQTKNRDAISMLIIMAIYEELLYRIYLPEAAKQTFVPMSKKHFISLECAIVLLFALAHRWQGGFAVLYAFFAGAFFRFVYCLMPYKTLGFVIISLAHIANNLIFTFYLHGLF